MKLLQLLMVSIATMFIFSCTPSPEGETAETTEATDTAVATDAAKSYNVDTASSLVNWEGTKPGGKHIGTLGLKSGSISVENGQIQSGDFILDMASIVCTDEGMDDKGKGDLVGHLSSPDFFDVAKFPEAKFEITEVTPKSDVEGVTHSIKGNLTMKEKTLNVAFDASVNITENGISAESNNFVINRLDWDVSYGYDNILKKLKDGAVSKEMGLKVRLVAN